MALTLTKKTLQPYILLTFWVLNMWNVKEETGLGWAGQFTFNLFGSIFSSFVEAKFEGNLTSQLCVETSISWKRVAFHKQGPCCHLIPPANAIDETSSTPFSVLKSPFVGDSWLLLIGSNWWFQPLWKILVRLDPNFWGEKHVPNHQPD